MLSAEGSFDRRTTFPRRYRFLRWLVRVWFSLFFPKIRLLHAEAVPAGAATLLVVNHPPGFLDAVLLIAAFERPVRCLLPQGLLQGGLRNFLAQSLGMVSCPLQPNGSITAGKACREFLERGEAVALFAEPAGQPGRAGELGRIAASIALGTETGDAARQELTVFPVHLFLSPVHSHEMLIYVDDPVRPREYLARQETGSAEAAVALAARIEQVCQENAFRLLPQVVEQFLRDLEEVLRADLAEEWASRKGWKQKVEGFELSPFVVRWTEQTNGLEPARLVALRERVDEYREERRRWSLRGFDVEAGGKWLASRWRRACIWFESLAGLPVAVYGLLNHLLVLPLLFWFGLLRKQSTKTDWLLRALVVLACYSGQVLLCDYRLGRAAAGFYAASLPLGGAYLWRYVWLLRHRTRRALVALLNPGQAAQLRRRRKELVAELNRALRVYAEALGVAH